MTNEELIAELVSRDMSMKEAGDMFYAFSDKFFERSNLGEMMEAAAIECETIDELDYLKRQDEEAKEALEWAEEDAATNARMNYTECKSINSSRF